MTPNEAEKKSLQAIVAKAQAKAKRAKIEAAAKKVSDSGNVTEITNQLENTTVSGKWEKEILESVRKIRDESDQELIPNLLLKNRSDSKMNKMRVIKWRMEELNRTWEAMKNDGNLAERYTRIIDGNSDFGSDDLSDTEEEKVKDLIEEIKKWKGEEANKDTDVSEDIVLGFEDRMGVKIAQSAIYDYYKDVEQNKALIDMREKEASLFPIFAASEFIFLQLNGQAYKDYAPNELLKISQFLNRRATQKKLKTFQSNILGPFQMKMKDETETNTRTQAKYYPDLERLEGISDEEYEEIYKGFNKGTIHSAIESEGKRVWRERNNKVANDKEVEGDLKERFSGDTTVPKWKVAAEYLGETKVKELKKAKIDQFIYGIKWQNGMKKLLYDAAGDNMLDTSLLEQDYEGGSWYCVLSKKKGRSLCCPSRR